MSETKQIFRKGHVIIARGIKSNTITCDTVLTKLCEKIGANREKYRREKFPFVAVGENDSYHLQKLRACEGLVNDEFCTDTETK